MLARRSIPRILPRLQRDLFLEHKPVLLVQTPPERARLDHGVEAPSVRLLGAPPDQRVPDAAALVRRVHGEDLQPDEVAVPRAEGVVSVLDDEGGDFFGPVGAGL
jgi:hypothetical protein